MNKGISTKSTKKQDRSKYPLYREGYKVGFKAGFEEAKATCYTEGKQDGFIEGVRHAVTQVENQMVMDLGLASREELSGSGRMPTIWLNFIIRHFVATEEKARTEKFADEEVPSEGPSEEELPHDNQQPTGVGKH